MSDDDLLACWLKNAGGETLRCKWREIDMLAFRSKVRPFTQMKSEGESGDDDEQSRSGMTL